MNPEPDTTQQQDPTTTATPALRPWTTPRLLRLSGPAANAPKIVVPTELGTTIVPTGIYGPS